MVCYKTRQGKSGETRAEPETPLNGVSQQLSQVTSRCGHWRHHQLRLGLINMLIFTLALLLQKHLRQYLANIHQLRRGNMQPQISRTIKVNLEIRKVKTL